MYVNKYFNHLLIQKFLLLNDIKINLQSIRIFYA